MFFGDSTTRGDHGVNMDIWSAGGGGGGIVTHDLHLHHHGGLPRTLHIFSICFLLQAGERGGGGKILRHSIAEKTPWSKYQHLCWNGETIKPIKGIEYDMFSKHYYQEYL